MTIIAAVKKAGEIYIGADTLIVAGSRLESSKYVVNSSKFICLNNSIIGFSGYAVAQHIVSSIIRGDVEGVFDFTSVENIYNSFSLILKEAEDYLPAKIKKALEEDESPFLHLLLANHKGIFTIDDDANVTQYSKFTAIGGASDYGLGAMHASYSDCTANETLIKGLEASIEFSQDCAKPYEVFKITKELTE